MRRALVAALVVGSAFMMGSAQPASTVGGKVQLMDFEEDTDIVIGYPEGRVPLGWYKRVEASQHVFGPPGTQFPPSPCRGLAVAWNRLVGQQQQQTEDGLPHSYRAFGNILSRMAAHNCNVDITRDTSTDPQEIVTIAPAP